MAKPLLKPQPKSSVDRFFSKASLEGALEYHEEQMSAPSLDELDSLITEPVPARTQSPKVTLPTPAPARIGRVVGEINSPRRPTEQSVTARGEMVDRKREFRLTKSTDETLEEFVTLYKHATGSDLTRSHVLRAVVKAIGEAMPTLRREAEKIGPLKRPSNAKGCEDRREEFEGSITDAFKRGMRG